MPFETRGRGISFTLRCGFVSLSTCIPSPKPFCPQGPSAVDLLPKGPFHQNGDICPEDSLCLRSERAAYWPCWVVSRPLMKHGRATDPGALRSCRVTPLWAYHFSPHTSLPWRHGTLPKPLLTPKATLFFPFVSHYLRPFRADSLGPGARVFAKRQAAVPGRTPEASLLLPQGSSLQARMPVDGRTSSHHSVQGYSSQWPSYSQRSQWWSVPWIFFTIF